MSTPTPPPSPTEPLNLRLEVGCTNQLLWGLELPEGVDGLEAARRIEAVAWARTREVHGVAYFEDPVGHQLVLVSRSGRLQLRLSYLFPAEVRAQVARAVAASLERALLSRA